MVTITNGVNTCTVTNSAYENVYKKQGFTIVEDNKNIAHEVDIDDDAEPVKNTDDFSETLLEKPIAQWSKAEVKKFAEENEIDISGTKNANEAKAIIKEWIAENE